MITWYEYVAEQLGMLELTFDDIDEETIDDPEYFDIWIQSKKQQQKQKNYGG